MTTTSEGGEGQKYGRDLNVPGMNGKVRVDRARATARAYFYGLLQEARIDRE